MIINQILDEETLHYAATFLERYADKHPTQNHKAALADMRRLSNELLDHMGQPLIIGIRRCEPKTDDA